MATEKQLKIREVEAAEQTAAQLTQIKEQLDRLEELMTRFIRQSATKQQTKKVGE